MSYEYSVNNWSDKFSLDTSWDYESPDYLAEDAAKDYYENHDGWESGWPIDIEIFYNKKSLGKFSVELEYEPEFSAIEID